MPAALSLAKVAQHSVAAVIGVSIGKQTLDCGTWCRGAYGARMPAALARWYPPGPGARRPTILSPFSHLHRSPPHPCRSVHYWGDAVFRGHASSVAQPALGHGAARAAAAHRRARHGVGLMLYACPPPHQRPLVYLRIIALFIAVCTALVTNALTIRRGAATTEGRCTLAHLPHQHPPASIRPTPPAAPAALPPAGRPAP